MSSQSDTVRRDQPILAVLIAAVPGTAVRCRGMYWSRVPGITVQSAGGRDFVLRLRISASC